MKSLHNLLENNKKWAEKIKAQEPDFFQNLVNQQAPEFLWIGCSDSRVPANQIVGLLPGEVFVHRNVANVVVHTDLNCLSVIQYAVEVLKVKHVIVCGHYGCGGVQAALQGRKLGLIDNWLRHVQDVYHTHKNGLDNRDEKQNWDKLCELNVIEQVLHVAQTSILQEAWNRGQEIAIHGLIYGISNGLIKNLDATIRNIDEIDMRYREAVKNLR